MQPHNIIQLHSATEAAIAYGVAFTVGSLIAAALVYLDKFSNQ